MLGTLIEPKRLRPHHDQMLIVKLRSSAKEVATSLRDRARRGVAVRAPGLAALHQVERKGQLRTIAHLKRRTAEKGKPGVVAHLIDAARDARKGAQHHGCVLVHLHDRASLSDLRRALARDPHVEFTAPVPMRYALAPAARHALPFPLEREWNLRRIELASARRLKHFRDADSVNVVVLDSGVDVRHPDLTRAIAKYVHKHGDLRPATSAKDLMGHGSHVCGIIAARSQTPMGPHGICRCRLTVHKVFVDHAPLDPVHDLFLYVVDPVLYRRALTDCVERGADVVNLSLGGSGEPDPCEASLMQTMLDRGTTIVAAMGNARSIGSPTMYPAAMPGVVAVGATDNNDVVASFSSRGSHIALCAPGVGIWSTLPRYAGQFGFYAEADRSGRAQATTPLSRNVWYDAWPGTSMATPHVSAAAALLRASRPGLAGPEVRERLMQTADRVAGMGRSTFSLDYGSGRLNLRRLLA